MSNQMFFALSGMMLSMNIIGMEKENCLALVHDELIPNITHYSSLQDIGRFKQTCKKYSNDDVASPYYTGKLISGLSKEYSMASLGLLREYGRKCLSTTNVTAAEMDRQLGCVQSQHLRFLKYFAKKEDLVMFDFFYKVPVPSKNYHSLLRYAIQVYDCDLASFLIMNGKVTFESNDDLWSYEKDNALLLACMFNNNKLAKKLLTMGVHVNYAPCFDRMTSLYYACKNGNVEMARLLIASGADVNLVNVVGESSLDIMEKKSEFKELIASLPFLQKNYAIIQAAVLPLVIGVVGIGYLYSKISKS